MMRKIEKYIGITVQYLTASFYFQEATQLKFGCTRWSSWVRPRRLCQPRDQEH